MIYTLTDSEQQIILWLWWLCQRILLVIKQFSLIFLDISSFVALKWIMWRSGECVCSRASIVIILFWLLISTLKTLIEHLCYLAITFALIDLKRTLHWRRSGLEWLCEWGTRRNISILFYTTNIAVIGIRQYFYDFLLLILLRGTS